MDLPTGPTTVATTLTPRGSDFRGYWFHPDARTWSRISCLAGQTVTTVDHFQGCCYTDSSVPCTVATACFSNLLRRSVLWTPSSSTINTSPIPCGNNECLAQAIYESPDNGSKPLQFWLCDENGLGNRVVLYETVTVNPTSSSSVSTVVLTATASARFQLPSETGSPVPTSSLNQTETNGMTDRDNRNLEIGMSVGGLGLVVLVVGIVLQLRKWRRER